MSGEQTKSSRFHACLDPPGRYGQEIFHLVCTPMSGNAERIHGDSSHKTNPQNLVTLLTLVCLALICYFRRVLGWGVLSSHFFYIPVVRSAFCWKRTGVLVPFLLAGCMLLSRYCCRSQQAMSDDYLLRALLSMVTALIVAILCERIEKAEPQQLESEARYRLVFEHVSDDVVICQPVGDGESFNLIPIFPILNASRGSCPSFAVAPLPPASVQRRP